MLTVQMNEREDELSFVKKAAKHFANNPQNFTYANSNPEVGQLLALRWGLDNDCVLVVKLDAQFTPVNYTNVIPAPAPSLSTPEWTQKEQIDAMHEGWAMMVNSKVCCVNLYPHNGPTLKSVEDALYMIRVGTGKHHKRARGLLSVRNPQQYERMEQVVRERDGEKP